MGSVKMVVPLLCLLVVLIHLSSGQYIPQTRLNVDSRLVKLLELALSERNSAQAGKRGASYAYVSPAIQQGKRGTNYGFHGKRSPYSDISPTLQQGKRGTNFGFAGRPDAYKRNDDDGLIGLGFGYK